MSQAVILAAGKSTRTYPLTITRPKSLIKIANKPVLQYNLEQLAGLVDEVIVIVGYKADMIKDHFGSEFEGMKITYVEQKEQLGTGHALMQVRDHIQDRFVVLMGDDIYMSSAIKECLNYEYSLLVEFVDDPSRFGVFLTENGFVKGFEEKPERPVSNLANAGLYVLDKKIFDELDLVDKSARGEYELTDAILSLSKKDKIKCIEVKDSWITIGYPKDILAAQARFLKDSGNENVIGKSSIDEESKITGCSIGDNCEIKNSVIRNSLILDSVNIEGAVITNSIIGDKVSISQGTKILENGLGAVIGDDCKIAPKTVIHPGVRIWPGKQTENGEVVNQDKT